MICWAIATIECCESSRAGLQVLTVKLDDGQTAKAYHYTDVWEPLQPGDNVLLNTTAVQLALGSGGYHFVNSVLSSDDKTRLMSRLKEQQCSADNENMGHLMKLRYTPQQRSVLAVEEEASAYHALFKQEQELHGLPVLIGELHSMLPIVMCWLKHLSDKGASQIGQSSPNDYPLKVAYILSDGGALPLALSEHVAALNELGWLGATITYGQAYGGDLEAMNKYTALLTAKHIVQADLALAIMGPGIAGTGTKLGHTGVEVGELINAIAALRGRPIVIPRISFAEQRERHRGISHHTLSSLSTIALQPALLPLPDIDPKTDKKEITSQILDYGLADRHQIQWINPPTVERIKESLRAYPLRITTMGRDIDDDPIFFQAVCSAAQVAWKYCN